MHEMLSQVMLQATMIWRRRWYVLGVAWLVAFAGWAIVPLLPDKYEASARVYVDTESMLRPLLSGLAVETNTDREIEIMQRTLLSRPNLERVARMTDLDLTATGPAEMEGLIGRIRNAVSIRSEARNLFTIKYGNESPQMARRVVQALLTIYVETNLGASRQEMDNARRFIDQQIKNYEQLLDAGEQRLAKFKQANMGFLPGEGGYYQRLENAKRLALAAQARLEDMLSARAELKKQLKAVPQFYEVGSSQALGGPPSDLQVRILEVEKAIDDMLFRYTPQHPDVVAANRRLENLRAELQEEQAAVMPDGGNDEGPVEKVSNPIYEQIKLQLVTLESNLATQRGEVVRRETAVKEMERLAERVPQVEAELAKLNRDYSVIRKNHEALLARRETAKLSEDRETKGEKVLFRIVDPAQLPTIPSGPPRALYLTLSLVVGIGAGVAFGWALANMHQTYFTASRRSESLAAPVIGAVSMARSMARRSIEVFWHATFATIIAGVVGVYGGLVYVERSVGLANAVPAEISQQLSDRVGEFFAK
ncbi:MAG: XrtA system polysaccharide chain length determinant [Planctomycetaceae bacterium]